MARKAKRTIKKIVVALDETTSVLTIQSVIDSIRQNYSPIISDIVISSEYPIPAIPIKYLQMWGNELVNHIINKYLTEYGIGNKGMIEVDKKVGVVFPGGFVPLQPGDYSVSVSKDHKIIIN